eukprot:scaffold9487_cov105-Isochrysis_galbana.AAC.5
MKARRRYDFKRVPASPPVRLHNLSAQTGLAAALAVCAPLLSLLREDEVVAVSNASRPGGAWHSRPEAQQRVLGSINTYWGRTISNVKARAAAHLQSS